MALAPQSNDASAVSRRGVVVAAALLVAAVAAVYAPVRHAGFFNLDDFHYITENPFVRAGLTIEGVRHAFHGFRGGLWMPLAFTSHMIDVELFGVTPEGPHLVNVALHAANVVLLLWLLVRTTGALAPSIIMAALFALHPLRVESVAWIAERKDVLSVFFGLLTLHAWVDYTRRPGPRRYLVVLGCTILALLSKPMLVTLPVMLLLLDWWPLRRPVPIGRLLVEKIPVAALAVAAAAITIITVRADAGIASLGERPVSTRLAHAVASYAWYVWKTAWPTDLAVFYPYPIWAGWQVAGGAALLAGGLVLVVATWRRAPWVAVGLLWFGITLLPVIGLVQAGMQGMADRFTYVPHIGLLVALVWTLDAAARSTTARRGLAVAAAVVIAALGVAANRQVRYWHDSATLLARTLAVTENNFIAETSFGNAIVNDGRAAEAYEHFTESLRIEPRYAKAAFGLGVAAESLGRPDEAIARYHETLKLDPAYWQAFNNLGIMMFTRGEVEAAVHYFGEAIQLDPTADEVVRNLTLALAQLGVDDAGSARYVEGLVVWSARVAADRSRPGGATYGSTLMGQLLAPRADAVRTCLAGGDGRPTAPFSLYVTVAADGGVAEVTAVPPTRVGRCLGDELRAARAPAPPFAPFHAEVAMKFEG